MSEFPTVRMRRLRRTPGLRRLVQEARLQSSQLVWPLFFTAAGKTAPVEAMPGVNRYALSEAGDLARRAGEQRLGGVLVFGVPKNKDDRGSGAYDDNGVVQRAVRALKAESPDLVVITDVCLCEYTSHGHCGVVRNGEVVNDESLELLGRIAVSHANAGADIVAPSDMMDGRVQAVRAALDDAALHHTPIMSYAAKYASSFYGPFRMAADSTPQFGDRRGYQMAVPNSDEAMREIVLDIEEGADIVMVKPAMPFLDIIRRARERFGSPLAAYQVSGEFSMIKLAGRAGVLDADAAMLEALLSIRRAGADIIISYAAEEIAAALSP